MELAILIGGGALLLVETHEKRKLYVTQMIVMSMGQKLIALGLSQTS